MANQVSFFFEESPTCTIFNLCLVKTFKCRVYISLNYHWLTTVGFNKSSSCKNALNPLFSTICTKKFAFNLFLSCIHICLVFLLKIGSHSLSSGSTLLRNELYFDGIKFESFLFWVRICKFKKLKFDKLSRLPFCKID